MRTDVVEEEGSSVDVIRRIRWLRTLPGRAGPRSGGALAPASLGRIAIGVSLDGDDVSVMEQAIHGAPASRESPKSGGHFSTDRFEATIMVQLS